MTVPPPRSPTSSLTVPRSRPIRLAVAGAAVLVGLGGVAAGAPSAGARTTTDQVEASVKAQFAEQGVALTRVRCAYGNARGTAIAREVKRLLEEEVGERARRVTCPKRVRIPTKRAVTCALTTRQGAVFSVRVTIDAKNRIRARVASRPR